MENIINEGKKSKVNYCEDKKTTYIGVIENIDFSFKAVEYHIEKLSEDIANLMEYKMLVLCLENAVELLFKFMIGCREEILLYSDDDINKVLKKYKKAHADGFSKLESYFCIYPLDNDLHTISFSKSCDILANYYMIITEEFAAKCKKLAQVRNGFVHYSTTIKHMDIITFLYIYKKGIMLYYKEMLERPFDFEMYRIGKNNNPYYTEDIETFFHIQKIYEAVFKDNLSNVMFLHILGFIIDDYSSALIDVNVDEFDKIETLFFKHNSKYYNKNELEKWHREFAETYKIMIEAGVIYENYEIYEDELGTLWIVRWILDEIMRIWNEEEQRERLKCEKSLNQIIEEIDRSDEYEWE